jgi:hypothetical protein
MDAKPETTKACLICATEYPRSAYASEGDGRILRICPRCRAERAAKTAEPKWDWAKAASKFAGMHARHIGSTYILTPEKLRALMAVQGQRCALTDEPFHLPGDTDLGVNGTFPAWMEKLPVELALRVPVLVRNDIALPWESGNVFFIAQRWQIVYEACAGLQEFLNLIQSITLPNRSFHVPTRDVICAMEDEIVLKRMQQ